MELFQEEYLSDQDDYLNIDPTKEISDENNDADENNDDFDENNNPKPIGDVIKEEGTFNSTVDPEDDEDDDFMDDDDEDLGPAALPDLDDDDLLNDDDDDVFVDETPASPLTNNDDFVTRHPERRTGRGVSDEPGLPGLDRSL